MEKKTLQGLARLSGAGQWSEDGTLTNSTELEQFARLVLEGFLDQMSIDISEIYHNEYNDYGSIQMTWFTGPGDPHRLYRGEDRGRFHCSLNEAAIDLALGEVIKR